MDNFRGSGKKTSYFEGWYLKHQNQEKTIAFIPAFHVDSSGRKSCSIQVITDEGSRLFSFPGSAFYAKREKFHIKIGPNIFSDEGVSVHLQSGGLSVTGEIGYGPFTLVRYDIMGPFRFMPFMQCNHGVLSLWHTVQGSLVVNGQEVAFDDGATGYIEKDWGASFPRSYLWTQCSSFGGEKCSVMISAAEIPFLGAHFPGCTCSVFTYGHEYRIATYLGAKIEQYSPGRIALRQGKYLLQADLLEGSAHSLLAPKLGGMTRTIRENIACKVRYRFDCRDMPLFDLTSERASFEFAD